MSMPRQSKRKQNLSKYSSARMAVHLPCFSDFCVTCPILLFIICSSYFFGKSKSKKSREKQKKRKKTMSKTAKALIDFFV